MCLGRSLLRGTAGKKHWVVYALRGNGRVYVGYTHRGSSRHSPRVPGSTAWISDLDGPPEELWSTDDHAEALALELWFWGIHVLLEPEGRECVRGGAYTLELAAWRKLDARQMEVALAWCRGLREGCSVAEAVAASWELAGEEYDALLHLQDRCFRCGAQGHKASRCKHPNPPTGGTAACRKAAHDRAKAEAAEERKRAAAAREAANVRAKAAEAARANAAAKKAAERKDAKAAKKRETNRNKVARARERKKEKKREHMRDHRGTLDPVPRFKPGVQPPINKRRAEKGTTGRDGKKIAGR